ncbi:MAG: energy transducer TonB [Bacteroidales bacterium]|jgi:TonB family protein|nr:energy transducer TonB [Bacteroidales bacterium]
MKPVFCIFTLIFCVCNFSFSQTSEETKEIKMLDSLFLGDENIRLQYLKENFKYPQNAIDSGIQGTVYVTFLVDRDGNIFDVEVVEGVGGGCDEEAVRLVKGMPNKPLKQQGRPYKGKPHIGRVQYKMPIKFILDESKGSVSTTTKPLNH